MSRTMDPRLEELLRIVQAAIVDPRTEGATWAIGGALAMQAHGVRRATSDVDLFVEPERRHDFLRALRVAAEGTGAVLFTVFQPYHYALVIQDHGDPEIRIDIMAPIDDPEVSAMHIAVPRTLAGATFMVFPPEMIVLAKFYSDQAGATDDIARLLNAGLVDQSEAIRLLSLIDPEAAAELEALFVRLAQPAPKRPRPKGRRLAPKK